MSLINNFSDDDLMFLWSHGPRRKHNQVPQLANFQSQQQLGMDLTEERDNWVVHADLPGFNEKDVQLSVHGGKLSVSAKREKKFESDSGVSHRIERLFGEVRRVMQLPKGANQDEAKAHLENGVLTVYFPKLETSEGRKNIQFVKKGNKRQRKN